MSFLLTNYFTTTLSAPATNTATTLSITSTTNFPTTIPPGMYVPLSLLDAATKSILEIVWVTSISGSNITVIRGQEGTTAQAWLASDLIYCAPTAYSVNYANGINGHNIISISAAYILSTLQSGSTIDTSEASAAFTLSLPASPIKGNFYTVESNGTYQITVSPNGGTFIFPNNTTSTSSYNLLLQNGTFSTFFFDGTNWAVMSPANFAFVNGNSSQIFNAANGTTGNEVVNFGQFTHSFSGTGYQELPSGFIIQWGYNLGDGTSITLPIAFPNAIYGVTGQNYNVASTGLSAIGGATITTLGQTSFAYDSNFGGTTKAYIYWLAWGR